MSAAELFFVLGHAATSWVGTFLCVSHKVSFADLLKAEDEDAISKVAASKRDVFVNRATA
jgi:hypothetical protein